MMWQLAIIFLIISFVYASVGFGGGSSYLAILALYHLPVYDMKLYALVCNIIVVTGGSLLYWMNGELALKKVLPLVLLSVPLAYVGAKISVDIHLFFAVLGFSLIAAGLLLFMQDKQTNERKLASNVAINSLIGGGVGFLSGFVGIGGGIFLSPILHIFNWDNARKIAATASFFILVNSISGLTAHLGKSHGAIQLGDVNLLCLAVLVGGQLGSRTGLNVFSALWVRRVTGLLVLIAGIEVLRSHVF